MGGRGGKDEKKTENKEEKQANRGELIGHGLRRGMRGGERMDGMFAVTVCCLIAQR